MPTTLTKSVYDENGNRLDKTLAAHEATAKKQGDNINSLQKSSASQGASIGTYTRELEIVKKALFNANPAAFKLEDFGIGILHVNGFVYDKESWSVLKLKNEDAVGVAVIDERGSFCIAKSDVSEDTKQWGEYGVLIDGVFTTTQNAMSQTDFDGEANTTKLDMSNPEYAGALCKSYKFDNGRTGYLPSHGELYLAYRNKKTINELLVFVGGDKIKNAWYWSSTQFSAYYAWDVYFNDGTLGHDFKVNFNYVRAFSALPTPFNTLTLHPFDEDGEPMSDVTITHNGIDKYCDGAAVSFDVNHVGEVALFTDDDREARVKMPYINKRTDVKFYPEGDGHLFRGIGVQLNDGRVVTKDEFDDNYDATEARGVAVCTEDFQFCILKRAQTSEAIFSEEYQLIKDILTTKEVQDAFVDTDGIGNTRKILEQIDLSAPAAEWCDAQGGYLPSLGELRFAYLHKAEIDDILRAIGGVTFTNNWYWSSTQFSAGSAWLIYFYDGLLGGTGKDFNFYVRAFSAL